MYIPKINLPIEGVEHARWLEKHAVDHDKKIDELFRLVNMGAKQNAVAARPQPVQTIGGIPEGGYRGSVLARDGGGRLKWTTPVGSIVPRYEIYLDQDAFDYTVNDYGAFSGSGGAMLPAPTFAYDSGTGEVSLLWPPAWADEQNTGFGGLISDPMPVQLDIYLIARSEGQIFNLALPSAWMGSGGAPWFTVAIYNDSAVGDYTADVRIDGDVWMYEGGVERPDNVSLAPSEYVTWRVDNHYNEGLGMLRPFWAAALHEGHEVGHPLDAYYWKHVRALENHETFYVPGALTTAAIGQTFTNGRETSVRVGKVTARVGSAPTGAAIQVQVLLNGVTPIFASPVTIAAGDTFGEGVPDDNGASFKFWPLPGDELLLLYPGEFLAVDVVQVGSTVAGSDLTVQVYFG